LGGGYKPRERKGTSAIVYKNGRQTEYETAGGGVAKMGGSITFSGCQWRGGKKRGDRGTLAPRTPWSK